MSERPPWKVDAALQKGLTVLEASAGTGKTWQIAHLVVRLVCEEALRAGELLVVTYTRAATAELRDRIRRRLGDAADALFSTQDPQALPGDEGLAALVEQAQAQGMVGTWLLRLRRAQEELDEATISTIHGFCQRMLSQHAFDSGADLDLELIGDPVALRAEVVDDVLTQALHGVDAARHAFLTRAVGFTRAKLRQGVRVATEDPDLAVLPDPAASRPTPDALVGVVADFLADFDEEGLIQAIDAAVVSGQIRPKEGKKKQTTYTAKTARKVCGNLRAWLEDEWKPGGTLAPPKPGWFSQSGVADFSDPDDLFKHEELERADVLLNQLTGWPEKLVAWEQARFVVEARARLQGRCRDAGQQTYSDLLRTLAHRLAPDSPNRERLKAAIAGRFGAVLIDEFQDTDARQWTLFETVFGGGNHHLYLIGDPKQAIYAFRGANVHVYERAVATAVASPSGRVATMGRNFRSDDRLVRALNDLWGDGLDWFGSSAIRYEPVTAKHAAVRFDPRVPWAAGEAAPIQLRFLDKTSLGEPLDDDWLTGTDVSEFLPQTVAADVLALLDRGPTLMLDEGSMKRPLSPGDIAVLVRTGHQAEKVVRCLRDRGLPAVRSGGISIFDSAAAGVIRDFLEALEAPRRDAAARRLALAPPFGWSGDDLARVHSEDPRALDAWEDWLAQLGRWRELAETRGVLPAWRRALDETDALARLLERPDGERLVTDLQHAMELLHQTQVGERLQLPALLRWFEARRAAADNRAEAEQLRLERDDAAIKVVTIHSSKGLEYPVVFLPWLWEGTREPKAEWLVVPSEQDLTQRQLDLRPKREKPEALARARRESRAEDMRLAYVALTRARHRVVLYGGPIGNYASSPLGTLLHGRDVVDPVDLLADVEVHLSNRSPRSMWAETLALSAKLRAQDGTPLVAASRVGPLDALGEWRHSPDRTTLTPRDFSRKSLDRVWRRSSYTSLVKGRDLQSVDMSPEASAASEVDHDQAAELDAVTDRVLVAPPPVDTRGEEDLVLASFPGGADAGTCLHAVFEHLDFQGDTEHAESVVRAQLSRHAFDVDQHADGLVQGLEGVLQTPFGGSLGTMCLADIPRDERLDELRFDLPIAGGDRHRRGDDPQLTSPRLDGRAMAQALGEWAWGPRPEYLSAVAALDFGPLSGFLTGSIDLVFRGPNGAFWVADYKSNRLDPHRTGRCIGAQFSQVHMAHEMERHHYYLQGVLYSLALHRWLGVRLGADYDPAVHLGGAAYLFVRGMVGLATPQVDDRRHGVCLFRPPTPLLDRLGGLFDDPATAGGAR